jgi:hypothetical protein
MTDDQTVESVHVMTNVRRLLRDRGATFANSFVGFALCCPSPRYRYAEYGNGEQELYDLARDPYELESRHADPAYTSVKADLALRLAHPRALQRPHLPNAPLSGDNCKRVDRLAGALYSRPGAGARPTRGHRCLRVPNGP